MTDRGSTSDRRRASGRAGLTGCLVFGVALVLCAAVVLTLLIGHLRHQIAPTPPDPAPFARSAAVREADSASGLWAEAQFRAIESRAPWLRPVQRSVLDLCSVAGGSGGLIDNGPGFSVSCARTDTRYYAYGGPSRARIGQIRRVLGAVGWGGFAPVVAVTRSLLPVVHADPAGTALRPGIKQELRFAWADHGSEVSVQADLGAVGPRVALRRNYYLQTLRPSRGEILASLTGSRPHLLIVSITVLYARKGPLSAA